MPIRGIANRANPIASATRSHGPCAPTACRAAPPASGRVERGDRERSPRYASGVAIGAVLELVGEVGQPLPDPRIGMLVFEIRSRGTARTRTAGPGCRRRCSRHRTQTARAPSPGRCGPRWPRHTRTARAALAWPRRRVPRRAEVRDGDRLIAPGARPHAARRNSAPSNRLAALGPGCTTSGQPTRLFMRTIALCRARDPAATARTLTAAHLRPRPRPTTRHRDHGVPRPLRPLWPSRWSRRPTLDAARRTPPANTSSASGNQASASCGSRVSASRDHQVAIGSTRGAPRSST